MDSIRFTDKDISLNKDKNITDEAPHILIIENDTDNLQLLENKLKINNFRVSDASSLIDVYHMIETDAVPDLILLTTIESGDQYIESLKQFREKYPQNILPIIIFTHRKHIAKYIIKLLNAGINDYISRPIVMQELIARLTTHIRLAQLNKNLKKIAVHEYIEQTKIEEKIKQIKEKYQERHIKVLLVDAHIVFGKIVTEMLASENDIDFFYCQNERKAIETAEKIIPDVILQDIELPHIHGLALVCLYKKRKKLNTIPVILLSERNAPSTKTCSFSIGACDVLVKPLNRNVLLNRIRYHAEKSKTITAKKKDGKTTFFHAQHLPLFNPKHININDYRQSKNIDANSTITVLLVDDQAFIGKIVGQYLNSEKDIDYYFCQDPLMAIDVALRIHPTVILQDLTMPKIDGLSMVRAYRDQDGLKRTPLIVLSSQDKAKVKDDAFSLGANDYMVKPPDKIELIARIRYHSKAYNTILQLDEAYKEVKCQRTELEIRNNFIKRTFGRYLSDEIVSSILDTPEGLKLGGEKRKVTILMSDLRGFTTIGEQLPPEDVLSIINIYLEIMTEIIMKYDGTIDEFIGDAILVMFGAPLLKDNDAIRAVACALEMQTSMDRVNTMNEQYGYPTVKMGIGINTGDVVLGNIGSDMRSKYGIVGSNVNLTSRIESYTVGDQILISETTYQECGALVKVKDTMNVMPKGVKEPITIYDITGIAGDYNINLPESTYVECKLLESPKEIQLSVVDGKANGKTSYKGKILKFADNIMEIQTDASLEQLWNIKISLCRSSGEGTNGDMYAKIVECFEDSTCSLSSFKINLTSVSLEAEAALKECVLISSELLISDQVDNTTYIK
ncbi:MAG: response regulator, partial [Candidatus Magnetomorum sp.]|nr:response regulator [Candidatus Magnetomorum sp.]